MREKISKNAKIAQGAVVYGDVQIEDGASIWYHAVLRADSGSIVIGKDSNIQDCCVVHQNIGEKTVVGEGVTVGHGAILHGCTIGDHSLIGMGSIILDGAMIGRHCIIGAGSLVTGGKVIPDGSLAFGNPARVIRELTKEEIKGIYKAMEEYVKVRENL